MGGVTQSVELLLDDEQDAAVRRQWAALAAELPSQARHTGETNRPHITLAVATAVPAYLETALKAALTGRLPIPVRLGGVLCFAERGPRGAGRQVLTRAVVPNEQLLDLHATCADLFEGLPGASPQLLPGAWSPHVTLAHHLSNAQLSAAFAVLGEATETTGTAVQARRWDSDQRTAWLVG